MSGDRVIIDVPCQVAGTDGDGVVWCKLRPDDYWGSQKHWDNRLKQHRRRASTQSRKP